MATTHRYERLPSQGSIPSARPIAPDDDEQLKHIIASSRTGQLALDKSRPRARITRLKSHWHAQSGTTKTWNSGWRFGVKAGMMVTAITLAGNVAVTIWVLMRFKTDAGFATPYTGSCAVVSSWTRWLHLAINICSCAVLATCNYCMQILSSPTREEVDAAHAVFTWLDIGVMSVRNLRRIPWYRTALLCVLVATSLPTHLFYNAAIIKTQENSTYNALTTLEYFMWDGVNETVFDLEYANIGPPSFRAAAVADMDRLVAKIDFWHRGYMDRRVWLNQSVESCQAYYSSAYISGRRTMLQLSWDEAVYFGENSTARNQYEYFTQQDAGYDETTWDAERSYCLSEIQPEQCALQVSIVAMAVVIGMELIQLGTMILTLQAHGRAPLVTIGDAIASFLDRPDDTTKGECLKTRPERIWMRFDRRRTQWIFNGRKSRTWKGSSWRHRALILTFHLSALCAVSLICAVVFSKFAKGVGDAASWNTSSSIPISELWQGFGTLNPSTSFTWDALQHGSGGLLLATIVANLPQIVVNMLSLSYNGLLTSMTLAREWSHYGVKRRPLRVSEPQFAQRSTCWLQSPFTHSLPILMAWISVHWFMSQAFFAVRIADYVDGQPTGLTTTMFVSGSATVAVIGAESLLLLVLAFVGFRRLPSSMPVAGSSSVAISAACHGPSWDVDAARKPVQWGVVVVSGAKLDEVGHCAFSSGAVFGPVDRQPYR